MNMARVKETQKEFIIQFMENNSNILFGKFSNSSGKHKKDELWNELSDEMNKLGPPTKSVKNWKNVIIIE